MIYEHSLSLSLPVFTPCFPVGGGKLCRFLRGNVCTVLSFCLSLSCTQTQRETRALLHLYLTPTFLPPSLLPSLSCLLARRSICADFLKRPSGCHLDTVDGPNCILAKWKQICTSLNGLNVFFHRSLNAPLSLCVPSTFSSI